MNIEAAGVINNTDFTEVEGTRRYRVPISRASGARDIAQTISAYSEGVSPARRNPVGEEVMYVVKGAGTCFIDGYSYALEAGTAIYIPPGSVYQIENLDERGRGVPDLETVSVCCPEDEDAQVGVTPLVRAAQDTKPLRSVRESDREVIRVSDRSFRYLVNQDLGAMRVTQFVGVIPPGRAPMHHHAYEEAIYIIEGEGRLWIANVSTPFRSGCSIYLPRGVSHCVENTGGTSLRLLGVFHPSGSPDVAYED